MGIIGVGGLGHFAILWAKALGAERVIAISRKANKRINALQLGADIYVATDDDPRWINEHTGSLDIIVSTVSSSKVSTNDSNSSPKNSRQRFTNVMTSR